MKHFKICKKKPELEYKTYLTLQLLQRSRKQTIVLHKLKHQYYFSNDAPDFPFKICQIFVIVASNTFRATQNQLSFQFSGEFANIIIVVILQYLLSTLHTYLPVTLSFFKYLLTPWNLGSQINISK